MGRVTTSFRTNPLPDTEGGSRTHTSLQLTNSITLNQRFGRSWSAKGCRQSAPFKLVREGDTLTSDLPYVFGGDLGCSVFAQRTESNYFQGKQLFPITNSPCASYRSSL